MFNFDKRPKKLFVCVGLINPFPPTQRHRWVGHPSPPNCKVNGTVGLDTTLTPRSPKSTVPLGWYPQLKWTTMLSWILHRLPPKGNGTIELDNTLKCTAFPKSTPPLGWISHPLPSQRQCWVCFAVTTPPKLSLHGCMVFWPWNACITSYLLPACTCFIS